MNKLSLFSLTMSFISLMAFWLVMSGFFGIIHITLGILSVASVMFVNYKLKTVRFYKDDMNDLGELRFARAIFYFFWMFLQVLKAGIHVVGILLRPNMPVSTSIIKFKVDLPSAHAKMILGNSITLTPGTLTLDITGDEFIVHALDDYSFQGIQDDSMPKQVLKLFEKEERPVVKDFTITRK